MPQGVQNKFWVHESSQAQKEPEPEGPRTYLRGFEPGWLLGTLSLEFEHAPDWRNARWGRRRFTFGPKQAKAVKRLYEAHQSGAPAMAAHQIIKEIGESGSRLPGSIQAPCRVEDIDRESRARILPPGAF